MNGPVANNQAAGVDQEEDDNHVAGVDRVGHNLEGGGGPPAKEQSLLEILGAKRNPKYKSERGSRQ